MQHATCNGFGSAMSQEWSVICAGKWGRARLAKWAESEPDLARFRYLNDVVEAIAVPVGQPHDESVKVTQAVLRLAVDDPLAARLLLHVMIPIVAKECYRSVRILRALGVRVDDSEVVTLVIGAAAESIASLAGDSRVYPLRVLRQRLLKRVEWRRERLIANARELVHDDRVLDVGAASSSEPPAVLLARTLRLAIDKQIISVDDASLVWASAHEGETSLTLAGGNAREAERLRRRRSRAQLKLAQHRLELVEAIA